MRKRNVGGVALFALFGCSKFSSFLNPSQDQAPDTSVTSLPDDGCDTERVRLGLLEPRAGSCTESKPSGVFGRGASSGEITYVVRLGVVKGPEGECLIRVLPNGEHLPPSYRLSVPTTTTKQPGPYVSIDGFDPATSNYYSCFAD